MNSPKVEIAVEGDTDIPIVRALVHAAGGEPGTPYVARGSARLDAKINAYNAAARIVPWLIVRDLDRHPCPVTLRARLVPNPSPHLCLRIAVREIEAWHLADHEALAEFLSVPAAKVDRHPEKLDDPKRAIIDLARRSTKPDIQEAFVPRTASGREVGAQYQSRMILFGERHWSLDRALRGGRAPSLARADRACKRMLDSFMKILPTK